ncbi:up-regulator, SirB [mine drainage metagenome]
MTNPLDFLLASHVFMATLSVSLLIYRGMRRLARNPVPDTRWLRITPHIVDTLLLVTGIALAWALGLDPLTVTWLGVKLLLIVAYIAVGLLAFRVSGPRAIRLGVFILALLIFADIVAIAITRSPWGFWA